MYPPAQFTVDDPVELAALLADARLGSLITHGEGGFLATAMPFVYDPVLRTLHGHVARGNPQQAAHRTDALVLFQGADAYVSPSFYPSKAVHGKVVPTWNYETLQVHGQARWIEDEAWLRRNLADLTDKFEAGRTAPWRINDAPDSYIGALLMGIVGVEITVDRIEGRRKLSQNRPPEDQQGVLDALSSSERPTDRLVADAMRTRRP